MIVYDSDYVEERNQPASFYTPRQVGEPKVNALQKNIEWLNLNLIYEIPHNYTAEPITTPVLVLAVDSLEERERIWSIVKDRLDNGDPYPEFVVDTRSGRDVVMVYASTPETAHIEFEPSLRREAVVADCSERAIAYNAATAAGLACGIIKAWWMGQVWPYRMVVDHRTWMTQVLVDYENCPRRQHPEEARSVRPDN